METFLFWGITIGAVGTAIALLLSSVYVVDQWYKAIILRFGKIKQTSTGGIHFKIPFVDTIQWFDMRMQTIDMTGQSAITKDNISVGIDAVVFMKIEDAEKTLLNIEDYQEAVSKFAQTSIRDVVGQYELDTLLANRKEVAEKLKTIVDQLASSWGIDITKTELQDISLPQDMKRAFAVQAESERESRAINIKANAELEASTKYKAAAENLTDPNAMQLRTLETIKQVSKDQSNTIIFALPTETIKNAGITGLASIASVRPKYQKS